MRLKLSAILIFLVLLSCGNDYEKYVGPHYAPATDADMLRYRRSEIWQRHKDAPLKILAIGNSFTNNATVFMPWLIRELNDDSICMATLTKSSCSLSMHWENHYNNAAEYEMYYSDCGRWVMSEFATIDDALSVLDWDIVVIQQVSGYSGIYSTYQPALDMLVRLFREIHPDVKIAWHYTWPYMLGTQHKEFYRYGYDPRKMYEAILEAGDIASEDLDIKIPSAELIWHMREQYPEVEDGFSEDGYHISDNNAFYALSALWYDILVEPYSGVSRIDVPVYPDKVDPEMLDRAEDIIRQLTEKENWRN